MGLIMVILGLIFRLALHFESHRIIGIILVIAGVLLLFAPWPGAYGYGYWRGRRGPVA